MAIGTPGYTPAPGDLFACWGADWLSRCISLETSSVFGPADVRWAPSHVGLACPHLRDNPKQCLWWESTTLSARPCLLAGSPVRGCQVHPITERLIDYLRPGGRVRVYRLTSLDALSWEEVRQLHAMLLEFVSQYDEPPISYDTAGALLSGTRIVRRFSVWRNQLESLFCSELIAAVLQRLNRLCRQNPAAFTPGRLVRCLRHQGTYRLHGTFDKRGWTTT